MKTVKIAIELTVDLPDADAVKDWLEDIIEKNFSEENEEIVSISLFA
jgi:disulfide oxidoreductase YuzD